MSLPQSRADVAEFRKRPRWLVLAVLLGFAILTVRLFILQVVKADEYKALARENIIRRTTLATTRGVIRDRFGRVLAASRPSYNLYCVPSKLDMKDVWPRLVKYMNLSNQDRDTLEKRIQRLQAGPRKDWQILVREDVSRDLVAILETHTGELPRVSCRPHACRYYPFKEFRLASPRLHGGGRRRRVDALPPDRLPRRRSSRRRWCGAWLGKLPARHAWLGKGRRRCPWTSTHNARSPTLVDEPKRRDPVPGRDLRLTLDLDIQKVDLGRHARSPRRRCRRGGGANRQGPRDDLQAVL